MKKSVIAVLVILALVVIVSPGIVGKMAEQSIGENLGQADVSGDFVVSTEGFDGGWFSSEGQHRIEVGESGFAADMVTAGFDAPALVINTRLDHGLIPVSSMTRDNGSLAPGLGSAISTMTVDLGQGESFDLPGAIYSDVGLGGSLNSNYVVDAGSRDLEDGSVSWEPTSIEVETTSSGKVEFNGSIGALTFTGDDGTMSIDGATFSGNQTPTEYGFSVGTMSGNMASYVATPVRGPGVNMQGFSASASSIVDDARVSSEASVSLNSMTIPQFGDSSLDVKINIDADAAAFGRISKALESLSGAADPTQIMSAAEEDIMDLLAAGLDVNIEEFNVVLPMGTVESKLNIEVPSMDRDGATWISAAMATVASLDLKVPEALVNMATQFNPQAGMVVGLGYLKKNGDVYEMDLDYKKGLMTINGAPLQIPFAAFQ